MINFNSGTEKLCNYSGSEKKTKIVFNNETYMLKFPDAVRNKKLKNIMSYANNQFSEYIGSNIFKACGFVAQDTCLGYYNDSNGVERVVVGCKDFTQDGGTLHELAAIANQSLAIEEIKGITIENVVKIINKNRLIKDKQSILNGFWDMFVIDALIGNGDRHFGNWGLLERDGNINIAPIYDCGSSLGALLDDDTMKTLLGSSGLFKANEYNVVSCYYMDGKHIFYHEIFKNPPEELNNAIKRIVPNINIDKLRAIVDSTPIISDVRKEYLKNALNLRYEQILVPALKRALKKLNQIKPDPDHLVTVEKSMDIWRREISDERSVNLPSSSHTITSKNRNNREI